MSINAAGVCLLTIDSGIRQHEAAGQLVALTMQRELARMEAALRNIRYPIKQDEPATQFVQAD